MKICRVRFILDGAAVAALACGLLVVGCSKDAPETPVDPFDKSLSRMEDKAYTDALHVRIAKRDEIFTRIEALENAIKEAEAKDPDSEEAVALRGRREDLRKEYDANQAQTEQLVRARILRENAAIEARKVRENNANDISSKGN